VLKKHHKLFPNIYPCLLCCFFQVFIQGGQRLLSRKASSRYEVSSRNYYRI